MPTDVRLTRLEWGFVALGVVVAHGFFVHLVLFPSSYDAGAYVQAARDIVADGLFSKFASSELRTYGYPLFLSLVYRAANAIGLPFQFVLFEVQLVLYIGAAYFARNGLVGRDATAAHIIFCGLLGNYYCLLYASDSLTESLSLTLLLVAVGCWLRLWQDCLRTVPLVIGSLAVGFAVMIRPANLFMVFAWVVGFAILWARPRASGARMFSRLLVLALATALPALPQLANNIRYYDEASPLVVSDLGRMQGLWGIMYLKYATALPPIPTPQVYYDNPFFRSSTVDEAAPWRWYASYPARGVVTVALHTFNLTDQDLLFTYSRDLRPWYRLPLGVLNHGVVALGLLGLLLLGRTVFASRKAAWIEGYVALVVLMGANWAVYALSAVEMRFGLVLLMVLFPLAGYALMRISVNRSVTTLSAVSAYLLCYIVGALLLSGWVRSQAVQIRGEPSQFEKVGVERPPRTLR